MNIFLDTTVTFLDPFIKQNYNRSLLKMAREYKDIKFYMSEVVHKETLRHFKRNVKKHLEDLSKVERSLKDFKPGYSNTVFNREEEMEEIEEKVKELLSNLEIFYLELQEDGLLNILSCPNDILSELVDRSVNRIKPFKERKSEFRDAVTWLTYTKYAEKNDLSNCYFISNNVTDFYDDIKVGLHPDLLKDSTRFTPYLTLPILTQEDLNIKKYIEEKQERKQKTQKWVQEHNIDENYVMSYFLESSTNGLFDQIKSSCFDYVSLLNESLINSNFLDYGRHDGSSIFLDNIDIHEIQNLNIEVIAEEIIVSGKLFIKASCKSQKAITANLHELEPEYRGAFSWDLDTMYTEGLPFLYELVQPFSFTLLMNNTISNLQLEMIYNHKTKQRQFS